VILNTTRTL